MENANPDSKASEAEVGGHTDSSAALFEEDPEDPDHSSEHDDDEEDLDNTDEDDYYDDSDYEVSISSGKGKDVAQNAAGNASSELELFRAEWLQNLKLDEGIQGQDEKKPEGLLYGAGQQDRSDSDGLSVSRLWLGDDAKHQQFEDMPSGSSRVETIGEAMDEFEQEQLLQEEMWKYYAANPAHREASEAPRYTNNSCVANYC